MSLKQIENALGALRLRQWMRQAGVEDFSVCFGSNTCGADVYVEVVVYDDDRRETIDNVLLNLRKSGLYTGFQQYVPAGRLCYLRFGIRVKNNMRLHVIGRHKLHTEDHD